MSILMQQVIVGPFQCNCSILICDKTKEAIVIDAGDEFEKIKKVLNIEGISLKYSLHTHAHLDHIGAVKDLKKSFPKTKVCLHKDDEELYMSLPMQGQLFGIRYDVPPPVDHLLEDEELLQFSDAQIKVIHTPGHSPGGACFHFKEGILGETPVVFSGDTLFQESIGRTDLWGADHRKLVSSIKEKLFTLPEEVVVLPGHGGQTTIAHEKRENPFL